MATITKLISLRLELPATLVVEATNKDKQAFSTRFNLDQKLGNDDGNFVINGSNFSHSARNTRLDDHVLLSDLKNRHEVWLEAALDLRFAITDTIWLEISHTNCPLPHELRARRGQVIAVTLGPDSILSILARAPSGQILNSRHELDRLLGVKGTGNIQHTFLVGGSNFSRASRRTRVDGLTLKSELGTIPGEWWPASLGLEVEVDDDGITLGFLDGHSITKRNDFNLNLTEKDMRDAHITLTGNTVHILANFGGQWVSFSVNLDRRLGNREGYFDQTRKHFSIAARAIQLTGSNLSASLKRDGSGNHLRIDTISLLRVLTRLPPGRIVSPESRGVEIFAVAKSLQSPLHKRDGWIRYCLIEPGDWNSEVSCQISMRLILDWDEYVALSYVWGDSHDLVPITVNGQQKFVTRNLFAALRRLRYREMNTPIWIDALCINQDDHIERAAQVSQMFEIYSRASDVLIWLGEGPRGHEDSSMPPVTMSPAAQALFQNLIRDEHLDEFPGSYQDEFGNVTPWPLALDGIQEALQNIAIHPWFRRVWTAQEIGSQQQSTSTFLYGNVGTSQDDIASFMEYHNKHINIKGCCQRCPSSDALMDINRALNSHLYYIRKMKSLISKREDEQEPGPAWAAALETLSMAQGRFATDPRDYIWGLHGCLPTMLTQQLTPDYVELSSLTFSRFSLMAMEQSSSFDIWDHLLNANLEEFDMPSWAVDWRSKSIQTPTTMEQMKTTESETLAMRKAREVLTERQRIETLVTHGSMYPSRKALSLSLLDNQVLAVRGYALDTVADALSTEFPTLPAHRSRYVDYMKSAWEFVSINLGSDTAEASINQQLRFAYWRALARGHIPTVSASTWGLLQLKHLWRTLQPPDFADFEAFHAAIQSEDFNSKLMSVDMFSNFTTWPVISTIWTTVYGRRLFVTRSGHLGVGPRTMLAGDGVFYVQGSPFPCLLRQKEFKVAGGEPMMVYRVVGRCWVDGYDEETMQRFDDRLESILLR